MLPKHPSVWNDKSNANPAAPVAANPSMQTSISSQKDVNINFLYWNTQHIPNTPAAKESTKKIVSKTIPY